MSIPRNPVTAKAFQTAVTQCMPIVDEWILNIDQPQEDAQWELEARLGKYDAKSKSFVSGVTPDDYAAMLSQFRSAVPSTWTWSNLNQAFNDDLYTGHVRHRWNKFMVDKSQVPFVKKLMIKQLTIKTSWVYDLCIALVQEITIPADGIGANKDHKTVQKIRHAFTDKHMWEYSFTESTDENAKESKTFNIELEVVPLVRAKREQQHKNDPKILSASLMWRASEIMSVVSSKSSKTVPLSFEVINQE